MQKELQTLRLCRKQHADVVEWMWLLNSHHDIMYKYALGDKDLYRLSFVLADKEQDFQQLAFAPRITLTSTGPPQAAGKVSMAHITDLVYFRHVLYLYLYPIPTYYMASHILSGNIAFISRSLYCLPR